MLTQEQTNAARLAPKLIASRWESELQGTSGPELARTLTEAAQLEGLWLDLTGERLRAFTEAFEVVAYTEVLRRGKRLLA